MAAFICPLNFSSPLLRVCGKLLYYPLGTGKKAVGGYFRENFAAVLRIRTFSGRLFSYFRGAGETLKPSAAGLVIFLMDFN
jgi:hypothetical protein